MADKKISKLNPQTPPAYVASGVDLLAIVDVSVGLTGETKRITISDLMGTPGPIGATTPDTGEFTALELATGPQVDEISTDTALGTNDDVLPTQNAVKTYVDTQIAAATEALINPVHVNSDSTAVVGDVILVDTTNGDVNIEMIETPKGAITVKKVSSDANKIILTSRNGFIYAYSEGSSFEITTDGESYTFVTDTYNFYLV
ncbi:MAG: hypothetical protein ACTSX1_14385 [Candidatus Heimdallarchaeaceae archaeon]